MYQVNFTNLFAERAYREFWDVIIRHKILTRTGPKARTVRFQMLKKENALLNS